jgi:hypothetical protein
MHEDCRKTLALSPVQPWRQQYTTQKGHADGAGISSRDRGIERLARHEHSDHHGMSKSTSVRLLDPRNGARKECSYALGTKNKSLKYDDDGGLTIYLGNKSPGKEKEANWLQAPEGNFSIWLRTYWPDNAILDGTWKPPVVLKKASDGTGSRAMQ